MHSVRDILAKLEELLHDHLPPGHALDPDTDLITTLHLDSAVIIDLVLDLEDEFDVVVPMSRLTDVRTAGELATLVHGLSGDAE